MTKRFRTLRLILELATSWYRSDRIRISPSVGRCLALQIGDRFLYQQMVFTVVDRVVIPKITINTITLVLKSRNVQAVIEVQQHLESLKTEAVFSYRDIRQRIDDGDIVRCGRRGH